MAKKQSQRVGGIEVEVVTCEESVTGDGICRRD